jgi:iron complex outermembrane receptor protein
LTFNNDYDSAFGFIKLYFNGTKFDILDETGIPGQWSRQEMTEIGSRSRETFYPWEDGEIICGFEFDSALTSNTAYRAVNVITEFPDMLLFSPYAAINHYFGEEEQFHLVPSAGARVYIHNLYANKAAPQAGISAGYNNTNINFNFALGVTYPATAVLQNFINENPNYNKDDFKKTNPEIVYHYEIALTHTQKKLFSAALSFFYDDGWDRIVIKNGLPENASKFSYYQISGIEAALNVTPHEAVELFSGASWFKAAAKGEDGLIVDKLPYTPTFSLSAGFKWNIKKNLRLTADYQHIAGLYAGELIRMGEGDGADFQAPPRENKLDDINIVNARISYRLSFTKWHIERCDIFVSVSNLLNQSYEYYAGNPMPGITVMAGVDLQFK